MAATPVRGRAPRARRCAGRPHRSAAALYPARALAQLGFTGVSANTVVVPSITFNADVDKAMQDATDALTIGKITPEEWVQRVVDVAKKVKK